MKTYYKRAAESEFGEGVVYMEFDGENATRQLEIYKEKICFGDANKPLTEDNVLCDQPLSVCEMKKEHIITKEEFEQIWNKHKDSSDK